MTALEQARALRQRGLSVFPIPVGTKTPTLPWKPYQDRLATDDELVAWFSDGPANIGVVTGAISGVVVVDADNQAAIAYCIRRLPYTPWQTGTSRGCHLWFAHPGISIPNRGTDLQTEYGPRPIHLRGDGGYVLAPGSVHPTGAVYREAGHWEAPRTELPRFWRAWLPARLRKPTSVTPAPLRPDGEFLLERARRYLAAIPPPVIGAGSDTATFKAACRLVRGFAVSPADAEDLLWEWAGNRDGWDRAWVAAKVRSADKSGQEAIGGLR